MKSHQYPRQRVEARLRSAVIAGAYRLIWHKHLSSPLGCERMESRFCDAKDFAVLYAASELETAFIETVVRDRFTREPIRFVRSREVVGRGWVILASRDQTPLNLLDLRDSGCLELGAPTDAAHSRHQGAGRTLARSIYAEHTDVDGMIYASRLTGADNYAVFDRALHKLMAIKTGDLGDHPDLADLLTRHHIELIAE